MTQPAAPGPADAAGAPAGPARVHRWRRWWIALAVIAAVALAVVAAEAIARAVVTQTIRAQAASGFGVRVEQVEVDVTGIILRQLVAGSLNEVRLDVDGVPVGSAGGASVSVDLRHVVPDGSTFGNGSATIRLTEDQMRELLADAPGADATTVSLEDPYVTVTILVPSEGGVPISAAFSPTVASGDLVLSPAQLRVAGADVSLDALRERFGVAADGAMTGWRLCLQAALPSALTLGSVAVDGDELVATFSVDPRILTDPDARRPGTCADGAVP